MTGAREIPAFAPLTLQRWFSERGGPRNPDGPRVVLWPDTFNNHFHTDVGVAASRRWRAPAGRSSCRRATSAAGDRCTTTGSWTWPSATCSARWTCCATRSARGTPVVGMEPSCLAVFKDELTSMLPHDDDAERLAEQAMHFGEFLDAPSGRGAALGARGAAVGPLPPQGDRRDRARARRAAADGPGRQPGQRRVLRPGRLLGLRGRPSRHLDAGRRAGAAARGARLPPVRPLVVANGFSCKTQIEHGDTGRRALHLAQVMQLARESGGGPATSEPPETLLGDRRPRPSTARRIGRAAAAVGGGLAAATAAGMSVREWRRR